MIEADMTMLIKEVKRTRAEAEDFFVLTRGLSTFSYKINLKDV